MVDVMLWDAFISHAFEDKEEFVASLADKLTELGLTIWYDDFSLEVGDSLSESIDIGLTNSEYGVVVLSKKFFEKNWTKKELRALETKAANTGKRIILPVWHNITKEEITQYSSTLADIKALNSRDGIDHVTDKLAEKIKGVTRLKSKTKVVDDTSNPYAEEYVFFSKWDLGEESDKFNFTEGIDIDSNGFVYVADEGGYVRRFDPIGSLVGKWGGKGNNDGEFQTAYALAVDSSNNIVVTDDAGRIQKFDPQGGFLMKWGTKGNGDGEFNSPFGIAIDNQGNIFISDESTHRVQKFDSNGKFMTKWGSKGDADGQFTDPIGLAIDSAGNIFVVDYLNNRIQVFDNNGKFIRKWGSSGKREGEFDRPHGITLDKHDMVYVSDSMNHRIQKFTNTGILITAWGTKGKDGQLFVPRDLAVDKDGVVYVSDGSNHRVQVFVLKNSNAFQGLKNLEARNRDREEIKQTMFYLEKISGKSKEASEAAWKGLEILARYRPVWDETTVWAEITVQLKESKPGAFSREALDLLRTMLRAAASYPDSRTIVKNKAKELYQIKLIQILENPDALWQHEKYYAKLVLDEIFMENERLDTFWKIWKHLATRVANDPVFYKFAGYFIRDLANSSLEFKRKIEPEIFMLIESSDLVISNRAKDLHSLLF